MKKISICLLLALSLCLCACENKDAKTDSPEKTETPDKTEPVESEPAETDLPTGESLEIILYDGNYYYGLAMSWELEELPDDYACIGQFKGVIHRDDIKDDIKSPNIEELTATVSITEIGNDIYHYTDDDGFHYFCVPATGPGIYKGIYGAQTDPKKAW